MQDEVNEKVVALSIKTSKLTAEVLQKAMKAVLAKGKQQLSKAPHGKISMRQLMKPRISKPLTLSRRKTGWIITSSG